MPIQSWIAGRYFRLRQGRRFLPLLTGVSVGGVALGTMALVLVLSVMRGFSGELEKKFMGFNSHVMATRGADAKNISADEIRGLLPAGSEITPFAEGEAIAQTKSMGEMVATGVKVRSITQEMAGFLKTVQFYFPEGSSKFGELDGSEGRSQLPGIILGDEILSQLTVHPDFEDTIDLVAPLADIGPTGEMEPRIRKYRLIGAFRSGVFEYDSKLVFVSLDEAKRLLGAQLAEGFQIMLKNPAGASRVAAGLKEKLGGGWQINSWDVQNKKLFAALKLERLAMAGILILIILIASFSIVGVLMMVVSTKRKDIAILRATGMNARMIRRIFLLHGMWIGAVGSVTGGVTGSLLCAALWRWPVRLPASYYLDILPIAWSPVWTCVFVVCGIFIAMIASWYPVTQATTEDPAVTLRYE